MSEGQPLVLVIDDDRSVRDSLKFALELEGLEVHLCTGGDELLHHPLLGRAQCLVLDHHMPQMDGFEVLDALAEQHCAVPVVMIASHATAMVHRRAIAAGVRHVVEKPFMDTTLTESIWDVLR